MATVAQSPEEKQEKVRVRRSPGRVRSGFAEAGELAAFAGSALRALPGTTRFTAEILRQAAILIRGSVPFLFVMTMFIGFAQVTFAYFFLRSAGASDFVGFFAGLTTPRAATPLMFGYMFAAKVGCGIVAEIGVARISEEIDALEIEGVDPMRYVVGTKLLGALLFVPIAVGTALLACTVGSYLDGVVVLQALPRDAFLNTYWGAENIGDNILAFVNMASMAMVITIVSTFFGFRASGGPSGVGRAVASSILVNLLLVHFIASFWVTIFYGTNLQLPFGG